jgi:SAM-dependent methyltransferase
MNEQETMDLIYEIFDASLTRQGPGDDASTKKAFDIALSALGRRDGLRILDLGCGSGAQTISLAKLVDGNIVAVDSHQPFLDELRRRADSAGVSGKIRALNADMKDLQMDAESYDLIWAEGSIFIIGFRDGLAAFRPLLTGDGVLAASELQWLKPDPPQECRDLIAGEYPPINDLAANLKAIDDCGYNICGHFALPESSWLDIYYAPLEKRLPGMRDKYAADAERLEFIAKIQKEIDIYRKYSDYYGYEFFIMRRR